MNVMKRGLIVLALVTSSAAFAIGQSAPFLGTWKTNLAKSTYSPGPRPSGPTTTTLEAVEGGAIRTTMVNATGEQTVSGPFIFDGREFSLASPPNTTHSFKKTARGYDRTVKENGKIIFTANHVVSADGKTLTTTQKGKTSQGTIVSNVIVNDRQ